MMRRRPLLWGSVCCIGIAGLFAAWALDIYIVDTDSMSPTLRPGDIVACAGMIEPKRGDIVVFTAVGRGSGGIKRVIGLPRDRISYVGKELIVQGIVASKQLVSALPLDDPGDLLLEQTLFGRAFQIQESYGMPLANVQVQLADDGYFVMGDNRDGSVDSRSFGPIPAAGLECQAIAIVATELEHFFSFARARMF